MFQSDGIDEEMRDDVDSVRGLLDRLKQEKERELLQEVTSSELLIILDMGNVFWILVAMKGHRSHGDFAVLGQFCAKILTYVVPSAIQKMLW